MAIEIETSLAADPDVVTFSGEEIELTQTVSSDLGGEKATITYKLDGRTNVHFETDSGPAKAVVVEAEIPGTATERTDTVTLCETGGGTGMAQVEIKQTIEGEENTALDSVTLAIND